MSLSIPVVLVSGSLGCGKTTYLRSIVQANPTVRFGVVVNEFGEVGVDGDLLSPYVPDIIEIRNGCICCVTQDQLVPAIKEIITKYAVDVLLIEMSGVADPTSVAQQVDLLEPLVTMRAHVVMGDCTLSPDEATRDRSYCNALARADVIALSKSDIATPSQISAWRIFAAQFNPNAVIRDVHQAEPDLKFLLASSKAGLGSAGPAVHGSHGYVSVYRAMGEMTKRDLFAFSDMLGSRIVRMKGIMPVDGAWCEVQRVRERLTVGLYDGIPADGGRLVFISNRHSRAELQQLVDRALASFRSSDQELGSVRAATRTGSVTGR